MSFLRPNHHNAGVPKVLRSSQVVDETERSTSYTHYHGRQCHVTVHHRPSSYRINLRHFDNRQVTYPDFSVTAKLRFLHRFPFITALRGTEATKNGIVLVLSVRVCVRLSSAQ